MVASLLLAKCANPSLNSSCKFRRSSRDRHAPPAKGEFQRSIQAILRMFVAPGVPNGTPAVMTTRWPISAIPSR
jgi:hypothetical protein